VYKGGGAMERRWTIFDKRNINVRNLNLGFMHHLLCFWYLRIVDILKEDTNMSVICYEHILSLALLDLGLVFTDLFFYW